MPDHHCPRNDDGESPRCELDCPHCDAEAAADDRLERLVARSPSSWTGGDSRDKHDPTL